MFVDSDNTAATGDIGGTVNVANAEVDDPWKLHGWLLWVSWGFLGFF